MIRHTKNVFQIHCESFKVESCMLSNDYLLIELAFFSANQFNKYAIYKTCVSQMPQILTIRINKGNYYTLLFINVE